MTKRTAAISATPRTDAARQRLYAAQDALGSLKRAEQVRRDPNLMRDVRVLAKQEQAALAQVAKPRGR